MGLGIVRGERDGPPESFLRARPVPTPDLDACQNHSGIPGRRVELSGSLSCSLANRGVFSRRQRKTAVGICQSDVSLHEIRVGINGLLEVLSCLFSFLISKPLAYSVEVV